jgi:metallophosphoesterase superfamily enzyme
MIQFDKASGKFRARWDFGHSSYYKKLLKQKLSLEKEVKVLAKAKKKPTTSHLKEYDRLVSEISKLELRYGKPVSIKTRRSFYTRHEWQAKQAEECFAVAHDLEKEGKSIPRALHYQINSLAEAPEREDFVRELSFQFASIAGFHESVLNNADYEMFLAQSDANTDWIIQMSIPEKEVRERAIGLCAPQTSLELKGRKYIYTGSFISYTACQDYIECLETMALELKIDGIITSGPWIKYIFLHKTAGSQKILDCVKRLTKKVKVYAIRSNKENADLIPLLKDAGIIFLNGIEDEKNIFMNHQFGRASNKDQLGRFRDYHVDKNIFVHSTYVAAEHRLVVDHTRMIIGSGSASHHTPSARIWANAYDGQHLNSEKYDEIGGHVLQFDEQSELYPLAFYYSDKAKGIFYAGKVYKKNAVGQGKISLLISDGHFNGIHIKGWTALKQFILTNRNNIDDLILNGDIFDNAVLCHWNEGNFAKQIKIKDKYTSFLHEIAKTKMMIKELVDLVTDNNKRKVRKIYKMGNHEISSFKKLESKSIVHFLSNMLDVDPLLGLSAQGFEIIPGDKVYRIGQVPILHGHEMPREHAFKVLGRMTTIGHSHRGSADAVGVILPTLEDQSHVDYFTYTGSQESNMGRGWAVGWGIITMYQGITEKTVNILVYKDKYVDLDGIKKIKNPKEIVLPKQLTLTYDL